MKHLLDITPDVITDKGIFQILYEKDNSLTFLADGKTLDIDYYYSNSGLKVISPLYKILNEREENGEITSALDTLATIILARYKDNWLKVYSAYVESDYNPLNDYNLTRDRSYDSTINENSENDLTREDSLDSSKTGTKTADDTTTRENSNANKFYGFNSVNAVDTDSSNGTDSEDYNSKVDTTDTETSTSSRSQNESGTRDTKTKSTDSEVVSGKSNESSYQKMLQDELELRRYFFLQKVYQDVDSVLVQNIYYN